MSFLNQICDVVETFLDQFSTAGKSIRPTQIIDPIIYQSLKKEAPRIRP